MGRTRSVVIFAALAVGLGVASPTAASTSAPASASTSAPAPSPAEPAGCDPIDPRLCLLPFPSNQFTVADAATPTGRRIALPAEGAPVNADGVAMDLTEWNRNDGFSPNSTILAYVADLDAEASKLPTWTDITASTADNVPVVLIDMATLERIPLWAELDARSDAVAADRLLMIRPADVLTEGHTYAVGLHSLIGLSGAPIEPTADFAAIRDGSAAGDPELAARAERLEPVFAALAGAGVERDSLVLAWDFTVASTENITGRMIHIRDETLAALGDAAPPFTVDVAEDNPVREDGTPREGVARRITGTFTVTNWLTGDGSPGQRFNYAPDGGADALPVANGTLTATFQCSVPTAVMEATEPGRLIQYGHGLLGSEDEIDSRAQTEMANVSGSVVCGTKWAGMSEEDIGNAAATLGDFSNFPTLADRLQQGVLNQVVLTRLMLADDGFVADPAFQRPDGSPLIDNSRVAYNGNSQGAIMGLMFAGVSTDIDRFVLGVAGMNYSLLLPRSVDFDTYEAIFDPAYPNEAERMLILSMAQMLWDRGEGAGYVNHVTADPLPGTPAKTVLIHVAFGDWQVTELSAFVEATAMDVPIYRPVAADGRSHEVEPGWGLPSIEFPSSGSGLVVWDSGSDPIPIEGLPPSTSRDPHEDPRRSPAAQMQITAFLFDGQLVDVCSGAPCTADPVD
jgi:hypothetical protein